MSSRLLACLGLMALLGVGACAKKGGKCTTDSGTVDTYNVVGKWKKISGYIPEKNDDELNSNYEQLFIEPGVTACLTKVVNKASVSSIFNGSYSSSITNKKLSFPDGTNPGYAFTGSCGETEMTLTYSNGHVERYELLDTNIAVGACNP